MLFLYFGRKLHHRCTCFRNLSICLSIYYVHACRYSICLLAMVCIVVYRDRPGRRILLSLSLPGRYVRDVSGTRFLGGLSRPGIGFIFLRQYFGFIVRYTVHIIWVFRYRAKGDLKGSLNPYTRNPKPKPLYKYTV